MQLALNLQNGVQVPGLLLTPGCERIAASTSNLRLVGSSPTLGAYGLASQLVGETGC